MTYQYKCEPLSIEEADRLFTVADTLQEKLCFYGLLAIPLNKSFASDSQQSREREQADVVILQPDFIAKLVSSGRLVAGDYPVIARVGLGLMAWADAPSVDISTTESFKETILCDAKKARAFACLN
jgi:hypothetical protein